MLSVSVDIDRFRELRNETFRVLRDGTRRAVLEGGIAGADHARNNHPHKTRTGRLTGVELWFRLRSFSDVGVYGELVNETPYAKYVEEGTRAHQIWPKAGHGTTHALKPGQSRRQANDIGTHRVALRWYVGGKAVFASHVNHPGTPSLPFMAPAGVVAGDRVAQETESVTIPLLAALWD